MKPGRILMIRSKLHDETDHNKLILILSSLHAFGIYAYINIILYISLDNKL